MKRARFTGEQIIAVSKEHEGGRRRPTSRAGMGSPRRRSTNWKAKFGGMDVCKAKRLMALEEENAKLKKLLAEQSSMRLPFASCFQKLARPRRQARNGLWTRLCVAGCEISPTSGGVSVAAGQESAACRRTNTGCRPLQERLVRVLSDASR